MKVAIIGSGISGLSVAHQLRGQADITLFEAGDYFGGHTHTVDVTLPDASGAPVTHGVDTGFLVFNERTYPHLIVCWPIWAWRPPSRTCRSRCRCRAPWVARAAAGAGVERHQPQHRVCPARNLVNPRFLGMLRDLLRFNKLCTRIAQAQADAALMQPLGDFLKAAPLWRRLPRLVLPAHAGLHLELPHRPDAEVPGGHHDPLLPQPRPHPGQQPAAVVDGVRRRAPLCGQDRGGHCRQAPEHPRAPHRARCRWRARVTDHGTEHFDQVVLATHSDQSLALLAQPTRRSVPCWAPSATSQPRRAAHRHLGAARAARLGRVELRARPARAANRPACACTTSSTSCSPCRLPSPWWCRSTRCATLHPSR
jgi:hypothetical protein